MRKKRRRKRTKRREKEKIKRKEERGERGVVCFPLSRQKTDNPY